MTVDHCGVVSALVNYWPSRVFGLMYAYQSCHGPDKPSIVDYRQITSLPEAFFVTPFRNDAVTALSRYDGDCIAVMAHNLNHEFSWQLFSHR